MRIEGATPVESGPAAKSGAGIEDIQRLLAEHYPSAGVEATGRWSTGDAELLRAFQKQRGLPETGHPDADTISELKRAVEWIRHERTAQTDDAPPSQTGAVASPSRRPASTEAALLEQSLVRSVDQQRTDAAGARAAGRALSFAPRALGQAERLILTAFLEQPHIRGIRAFAQNENKTVLLGVGGSGALPAGREAVQAGIYFGPNGEVGLTGGGGRGLASQIAGISGTAQVTVLDGGVDMLRGNYQLAGVSGGELLTGGVSMVMQGMDPVGLSFEVGVGAGVIPIEIYYEWGISGATGNPSQVPADGR